MSEATPTTYDPQTIEAARQAAWHARAADRTPEISDDRRHIYIKPSAPFTSGNIHMGHVRSYSIGDAYARFRRARGDAVLFAFGFDAFGLPAELGAIASKQPPSEWVDRCARHMRGQLDRLGFSFDWERSFMSSDAIMYRWSQWLFLTLLDAGLIYRGSGNVDWCDSCQTTLASIQVEEGGTCWRCHGPVRLIQRPQWYLRISAYLEENDRRVADFENWDSNSLASQQIVLGRVDGVETTVLSPEGDRLTVFTPHAGALADARFVLMSARHEEADIWASTPQVREELELMRSGGWERSAREAETVPVIDTGRIVEGPGGRRLPVLVSPVVDSRFGVTVVLGIPAHDRTDEAIARRMGIGFEPAGDTEPSPVAAGEERADGVEDAGAAGIVGVPTVRYRAFDFAVSRQRSWGTPIPIVYCEKCGTVPVSVDDLPVLLPLDITPTGEGNPLAESREFVETTCPGCGGPAERETDTLDCHFDALWLWIPACVPPAARQHPMPDIFALADLRHWLPSERLVAGSDSGNFVFDQRIITKALRDIGPLAFLSDGEPFAGCLFHEMVISDGRKMSKHLGNVVDPDELVARYGADTVRMAVLYAARPQRSLNWSDSAVLRCHRFLNQVWEYSISRAAQAGATGAQDAASGSSNGTGEPMRDTTEHLRQRLGKWTETAVEKVTEDMEELEMHSAVRNVMRLFDRIRDYEKRVLERQGELAGADAEVLIAALTVLVQLLGPFAPHLAEELWIALGQEEQPAQTPWPGVSLGVAA